MLACILLLASVAVAVRLDEVCKVSTIYQQLCWPAQGKLHVLWSDTVNRSQWEHWEQVLPDITPTTAVASSVWQSYHGVAWPAEGKLQFYFATGPNFTNWTQYEVKQPDVISSTYLASAGCSKHHLISWPDQGKMHMFWRGEANNWHDWERVEYSEHLVLNGLTPDSPVTAIVTDTYHGVAWPDQGEIHFLEEDEFKWNSWMRSHDKYPDITPQTILGSDGTADYHLVSWPAKGKLHMLSRSRAMILYEGWTKWESGVLPDLSPTSLVTVSVSHQVRAVYWPGQGKIHVFSESSEKWGDWRHYEIVQPDVSLNTRLGSGGESGQPLPMPTQPDPADQKDGARRRACVCYFAILITITSRF